MLRYQDSSNLTPEGFNWNLLSPLGHIIVIPHEFGDALPSSTRAHGTPL